MQFCWLLSALLLAVSGNSLINVKLGKVRAPQPFLAGYNLDSASLYHGLNLTDPVLIHAAKYLAPGVLRVGGGMADNMVFDASDLRTRIPGSQSTVIPAGYWDDLVAFSRRTGLKLLFDLNCFGFRTPANAWSPVNAMALLQHVQRNNQTNALFGFQLGNEPAHYLKKNSSHPSAQQMAADFVAARQLLDQTFPDHHLALFGPDLCCGFGFLNTFLQAVPAGTLDAITVHSYPLQGPKGSRIGECTVANFTNPLKLDRSDAILAAYKLSQQLYAKDTPLVLGETATAGDGGCPALSNRYAAGFFWMDQLGRLRNEAWHGVFRQDLIGWSGDATPSNYALLGPAGWVDNSSTVTPHPDFFTTRLWRQLMGNQVIEVLHQELGDLRLYASCHPTNKSVVVAYVNLGPTAFGLAITGADMTFTDYALTATQPTDDIILLNGKPLRAVDTPLAGVSRTGTPELAPSSYGFLELTGHVADGCQATGA